VGLVVKVAVGTAFGDAVDEYVGDDGTTVGVFDGKDGLMLGIPVGSLD